MNNSTTSSAYHHLAQAYVDDLLEAHSRRFAGAGIFDNDPTAFTAADGPTDKQNMQNFASESQLSE